MIDWILTNEMFNINENSILGRRPKVICKCDNCSKISIITVRVKSRLKDGFPWLCPSCVSKKRSHEISKTQIENWNNQSYREKQIAIHNSKEYKSKQSKSIKEKWKNENYSSQLSTGINKEEFIKKSIEKYGDTFDYTNTDFKTWKDTINIKCKKCGYISHKYPQKQLDYGYCQKCGISKEQNEIVEFIQSIAKCTVNDRNIIKPYELDIFIESHNIAIEYHGVYWHSYDKLETKEERYRHQNKATLCKLNNIKLFQFFEFEWYEKRHLIKSMIKNALNMSEKVNARDLKIKWISNKESRLFFDNNHLYGHRSAKHTIALCDNDNIIIAASFSKYKDGYEIIRLATACGISVRGGASRIISTFKKHYKCPIYTFADLRYSDGNVYKKLGFTELHITHPNYMYIKNDVILSRQKCQKNKLYKLLEKFDPNLSESQNMFNNSYRRLWDAGNIKMVLKE